MTEWVLAHPTLPVLYVVDNRGPSMPGRIFAYRIHSTRESDDIELQQISMNCVLSVVTSGPGAECFMIRVKY